MSLRIALSISDWARDFPPSARAVVAIGNFDGLHLGHQRILRRTVIRAAAHDALAAAITFDPHPLKFLRPEQAPSLIATLAQRLHWFDEFALDAALVLPFDKELSLLAPEEFVRRYLVEGLRVSAVIVGENFRFGHKHAGDVQLLRKLGSDHHFEVETVAPVSFRGQLVSSTAVRDAVRTGRMTDAIRLLGRPFALTGEIESGTGTGRRVVVPTLNLAAEQELLPGRGVYVTESWLAGPEGDDPHDCSGRVYRSVTNVGTRPTFAGARLTIESHLFDFSGELYTHRLGVSFWHRIREEMKFSSPEELLAQIRHDMDAAQEFFRRLDRARRSARHKSRPARTAH